MFQKESIVHRVKEESADGISDVSSVGKERVSHAKDYISQSSIKFTTREHSDNSVLTLT